jgi:hypothetical protein
MELLRDMPRSLAELDARVDERAVHDREHDDGGDEHDPVDVGDRPCHRTLRIVRPGSIRERGDR